MEQRRGERFPSDPRNLVELQPDLGFPMVLASQSIHSASPLNVTPGLHGDPCLKTQDA